MLGKLATGMIEDDQLAKEEVELAISRSMMVAKEFEMLLHEIPAPGSIHERIAPEEIPISLEPIGVTLPIIPPEVVSEKIEVVLDLPEKVPTPNEAEIAVLSVIHEDETPLELTVPPEEEKREADLLVVELIENESPHSTSSPHPVVPSSPHPLVPPSPRPEPEEHAAIDHEVKKEEHPLFKLTPIKSLKEGMTLNDRYLFQKELFGNDKSRLDETVADMDRLANIQEAIAYLKAHFKWMKGEASEKFILLVKRRFSEPKG